MGIASNTPEPLGPGDLWHVPGLRLPPGLQHLAHALMRGGRDRSTAIRMAVGIMRNFADGHNGHGGKVKPETQARAQKVMAQYDKARAKAHATPNKSDRGR